MTGAAQTCMGGGGLGGGRLDEIWVHEIHEIWFDWLGSFHLAIVVYGYDP